MDCGEKDVRVLEFDHVRGKKGFDIGNWRCFGMLRLLEEIAKCDVVCANCHLIRGWQRRQA
jgi:hypothetical protein